ncbi:hypothetical protein Mgra_00006612 [Meloidogyne graminicola]|uniref:Uncharacterized protein n=1 Tax=Meloidogyne graminicola TaxID=189291 RepID=A0A8S9ZLI3_9BILA|nr:hypothetical protein Mgra_00006612 [Meloidogyne graminicola]
MSSKEFSYKREDNNNVINERPLKSSTIQKKKRKKFKHHHAPSKTTEKTKKDLKLDDEIKLPPINPLIKLNRKNQENLISTIQNSEEIAKQIANSTNTILYKQPQSLINQTNKLFFQHPKPLNSQKFLPPQQLNMHGNSGNIGRPPPIKRPHLMHQTRHHLPQHQRQRIPHPKNIQTGGPSSSSSIPQQTQQQQGAGISFPQCANDVLIQVADFVKQHGQFPNKSWNRVKIKELQNLLDQDLFCLSTDLRSSRLNPLQHFKLLGIEVSMEVDPKLRYLHFDIIFCGREGEPLLHEARVHFLIKLCSLATQFPVYGLFDNVAQWVTSDDLKRTYADQIVSELVEGFIFGPKKYKLHEHLLPLVNHSFEFCANFIVFSVSKETLSPVMASIIGEWLCPRIDQFLRYLSLCTHLSLPFCGQKFDLIIRYDCTAPETDEIHYKLHYVLIKIINEWKHGFTASVVIFKIKLIYFLKDKTSNCISQYIC